MAEAVKFDEIFRRKEVKYLLTQDQYHAVWEILEGRMFPDKYGKQTIRSIYYDTPDFRLIRRSLQKPVFKEKLRVRTYGPLGGKAPCFAEIKKKFHGIVYKRRIAYSGDPLPEAMPGPIESPANEITRRELIAMFDHYPGLAPACFIGYERMACAGADDLRITFDENLRFRTDRLGLQDSIDGQPILAPGFVVMEVKYPGGSPLWLAEAFSKHSIFPKSMSKYGMAFTNNIAGGIHFHA